MSVVAILGSSRADGETARLLDEVLSHFPEAERFDLGALRIAPYSYEHVHSGDDFLPLARQILKAQTIIFASPVYWYSMSGQMKIFFDRLTDLTDPPYKALGRQLAGKTVYAVATGGDDAPPTSFSPPFSETAGYFNMGWGGMLYRRGRHALSLEDKAAARAFAEEICALA